MSQAKEMTFSPGGYTGGQLVSTLISIVPFPIKEFKPGLIPGFFELAASIDGRPTFRTVGESYHFVYIDAERGNLRVLDPSYDVAQAVVSDYNSAQLEASPEEHPGLFWLLGEWDEEKLMANAEAMDKLRTVEHIQWNWFLKLIMLADDDWQRTHQHSAISDVQRFAARTVDPDNKKEREWVFSLGKDEEPAPIVDSTVCPACGSDVVRTAVVCRYCKYILDEGKYAQMKFADLGGTVGRNLAGVDIKSALIAK